ncbi:uncharacterized protein LOC101889827 [Musca domestica]|uniref:Uncharacterized protein LOC101889827 n=1 Tax=Musca domestica TaxID=7370 RepID=A0A9J7DIU2_MUSDO|nr:uncharacterized protein LOC101889827 [Musca domestica]XP_019893774.2 uncharacterized protein LOC101889827 [Musca domestica]XP_019893775.2 uncharacterized protein LOC101889827 [Musca domestica]XP_058985151.1 uncharacterized protein LOC101889827 [Musca domestica]XP_058985152.1 uncharacterized protein LOC101889827 [Musca domestica]
MDQWVSDTFYSYFPGFNNEYQKRQLYLQQKQRENQENFLKNQHMFSSARSPRKQTREPFSTRSWSNNSETSSGIELTKDEGDLSKNTGIDGPASVVTPVRPGSTRYKLLQDLRHTSLSNDASFEPQGIMNRERKYAEDEAARKKAYQRELIQQIEEKRRSIKLLKEKEQEQEQVLTRRLQEQLKTIKLEEQLEKERMKATELRYKAEQNRYLRKHMLAKLENDTKLLPPERGTPPTPPTCVDPKRNKENISSDWDDNKVYRYFSNSAKNEYNYRQRSRMPANIDFPKIEKECFHISEKICPICDQPLREYRHFCLRCQTKMTLPMNEMPGENSTASSCNSHAERNLILVCHNCDRLYTLCSNCLEKADTCRACQNTRNVCMHCRRNLCAFCLEEISTNKNTENEHINERMDNVMKTPLQIVTSDEAEPSGNNKSANVVGNNLNPSLESHPSPKHREFVSFGKPELNFQTNHNNINEEIEKPYEKSLKNIQKTDHSTDIFVDSEENIDRLRRQTDKRLMGYFKNYGELTSKSRGTQTIPFTSERRDVVIRGGNNFSIPILCDMPKMTRRETTKRDKQISNELENLKYRWDIPAVQKFTISATSPKVVTQVGAIRKQLQTENLLFNDGD